MVVFIPDKNLDISTRLEQIFLKLDSLINLYKPNHLAIEELFFFKPKQ